MATIQSILSFQDKMSAVIDKVAKSLENATNKSNATTKAINTLENEQTQFQQVLNGTNNALNNMQNASNNASNGLNSMQGKIITLASAFQLFNQAKGFIQGVNSKINEFVNYTQIQMQAEDQLSIITKNRMGLMDEEVRSLYDLASAQQKVGVVGDEAVIAGMAGVAAFVQQKSSIEALTPAMNNLAVKMYGYNVNASNMEMVSKTLGRALQGDVGSLSRLGVKIDDVTKKRLMLLKEEERAIELAKIIQGVTGDMNAEMAKTPFGRMTQATNAIGDSYERLGAALLPLQATVTEVWSSIVQKIVNNLETIVPIVLAGLTAMSVGFIALKADAITAAISSAAAWISATAPIWIAVAAIGAVSAATNAMGISFSEQAENILISFNWIITGLKNIWIAMQNTWTFATNVINNFSNIATLTLGKLFGWIVGKLEGIARLIDFVFKTNLSAAVSNFGNQIERANNTIANEIKNNSKQYKQLENNDLYTNQEKAQRQMSAIKGGALTGRALLGSTGKGGAFDNSLITSTPGGKALKTQNQGKIEINGEDLQLLHDMATRDYMIKYSQQNLTPQVNFPNVVIHETADVDSVVESLVSAVTDIAQSKLVVT